MLLSSAGGANAQSAADAAREAFAAGLAAESAGKQDDACASFRKSLALVRELGPLQKAAACDEREGKLRSASALLEELLARLPADEERGAIEERLRIARSRLGRLRIVVRADAPEGVKARLDGSPIALPAADLLVDPGRRELVVEVPGKGIELKDVEVGPGGTATVTIPDESSAPAPMPPPPPPVAEEESSHTLRTVGLIAGGVGIAGFIGVAATGIPLLGKSSDFDECAGDFGCESTVESDAKPLVAINTVMWGVGIAGVGLGATFLLIDATSSDGPIVGATVTPRGIDLRGRF